MLPPEALQILLDQVGLAPEGPLIIAGSAHGGDAMAIIEAYPDKKVIVIDSFRGLAPPTEKDTEDAPLAGAHDVGGVQKYKQNFKDMGTRLPDELHQMWITDESLAVMEETNIGMLFMDLDHYAPVMSCLKYFVPRMVNEGIVLTHDYAFYKTRGVYNACQDFAPGKWQQIRGFGKYICYH